MSYQRNWRDRVVMIRLFDQYRNWKKELMPRSVALCDLVKTEATMDTRTLAVGQKVYMVSGVYASRGTVVEATPMGLIVRLDRAQGPINEPTLIRFDINGKACDSSDIYNGNLWGGTDPRIPGTHECGPWELDV